MKKNSSLFGYSLMLVMFFFCALNVQQTYAATFLVNNSGDSADATAGNGICETATGNGVCTLRAAIQESAALPGNDTVNFDASINLVTLTNEIRILNPAGELVINGNGANTTTIDGGAGINRIFQTDSATVTIKNLILQNGNGGGTLANRIGGAIFVFRGAVTLDTVLVQNNSTTNDGGGVYFEEGAHRIISSTFSGNTGSRGGAIAIDIGTLTMVNSTLSNNTATTGGGFFNCCAATSRLRNVTITGNKATSTGSLAGGGVFAGGTFIIGNTIIANSVDSSNMPRSDVEGSITSSGYNLIENLGGGTITGTTTGNQVGVDPVLGSLTIANGGTTPTHALMTNSPAIDTGSNSLAIDPFNNTALTTDQRGTGFPRIVDGDGNGTATVDIGAFEKQLAPTAAGVSVSGRVMSPDGYGIANARVTSDSSGEERSAFTNPFGYYQFTDVEAGETYVFSAYHRRYSFNQNTQVLTILKEINDLNFVTDK